MARVLVIFKRQRQSASVPWFQPIPEYKEQELATLKGYGSGVGIEYLTYIRTVYFATLADYTEWANSPAVIALSEARRKYHESVGIDEFKEVVSLTVV